MKRFCASVLLAVLLLGCSDTSESPLRPSAAPGMDLGATGVVRVTRADDDAAPGSFRGAIARANADPSIRTVELRPGLTVELLSPIVYSGAQDLRIAGHGATLDGSHLGTGETNFLAEGGGDLEIDRMTFRDAPGHGLVVRVPADASGTQRVVLRKVTAEANLGHGVEINDQEDPDDAGDPDSGVRGNSNGSDASLEVVVIGSLFRANGFGALDRDGLRINEGGVGDLRVSLFDTRARDNGADGVELDERGAGDLVFEIVRSHFTGNGDFDQSPDPDKDDGFDADEGDDGDLVATIHRSTANDNFEEGFDLNENDAGDMRVRIQQVEASRNPEEGIDLEEDDDWQGGGDLHATMRHVTANGNGAEGDGGVKIRERGAGDLVADLRHTGASENESAGIHLREQADGILQATLQRAAANDNGAEGIFLREDDAGRHIGSVSHSRADRNGAYGINFDENDSGDLSASVAHSSASHNLAAGVRADEGGAGTGSLTLEKSALMGNGADGTAGNVPPTR